MVTPGTSLATLKTVENEKGKCLSCRKGSQWSEREVGTGKVVSELTGGVPGGSGESEQGLSTEKLQQVEWEVQQFSFRCMGRLASEVHLLRVVSFGVDLLFSARFRTLCL